LSNPYEIDEDLRWKTWDCSFYGRLPSLNGDSAASITLPMDVILNRMEWTFPSDTHDGWILDLCIDEVVVESIPLSVQTKGTYTFKMSDAGLYLPKGTLVSTHIRYLHEEEEGDYNIPQYDDHRYSIFLSGLTVIPETLTTLKGSFADMPILSWNWFSEWQDEHS
tara:strand:+ start:115 stop:609 length:495 start_codon:yes stop_codon:yes gene_type:complete